MAEEQTVQDLLINEIKDMYSAEKQLTKAIPKMVEGSHHTELKDAFAAHLLETEAQVVRLEKIAGILEMAPGGKKCVGMEGCIKEGDEAVKEEGNPIILDLGIIGAGSRVEHYEIAGYTTAINLAKKLGESEVVDLLEESLAEERAAEEKLRGIADTLTTDAPM